MLKSFAIELKNVQKMELELKFMDFQQVKRKIRARDEMCLELCHLLCYCHQQPIKPPIQWGAVRWEWDH